MKKKLTSIRLVVTMTAAFALTGCGQKEEKADTSESVSTASSDESDSDEKVLKLGIECTFAPYNWTQVTEELANGEKAVKIQNAVDYEAVSELFLAIQNSTADVLITDLSTAESAIGTMAGLKMLDLDSSDDFVAPEGASNSCCILFRGGDEECETVQKAMDDMNWTDETEEGIQAMNDLMSEMIKLQPSSN